jgi:hypothetical protein
MQYYCAVKKSIIAFSQDLENVSNGKAWLAKKGAESCWFLEVPCSVFMSHEDAIFRYCFLDIFV